ncbi:MAG TPA: N-acetylmuramoyl-L-alanine amidase [Thermoanaerobaculia bacterium]|nr:N-acetylmuramoyl-L-alanine amidase [Thermoanaerobaculia bacterium]
MDPLRSRRRLKQRLLSEVVEDNLAEIRGMPRRPRRRSTAVWSRLAVVLVPLALVASSQGVPAPSGEGAAPAGPSLAGPAGDGVVGAGPGGAEATSGRLPHGGLGAVDPEVFPLDIERVVLDPGHGGDSLGARIAAGTTEKDLTLDIARRLADLLAAAGFEVAMTRSDDRQVSLEERARFANGAGADLFVSIHVNWITNRDVRGVETYYLGATEDPFASRLAATENVDSGYSQADLKELLASIYAGLRDDASRRAAAEIQRSLLRSLRSVNPAIADRGVKTAPFLVLAQTEMPAVLAEVSCLSNQEEAELLARPLYRQYIAEALAAGIVRFAESRRPSEDGGGTPGRGARS